MLAIRAAYHYRPVINLTAALINNIKKCTMLNYSTNSKPPALPVPPLEQTLVKYLDTVRPLVNDEQFENTKNVVQHFKQNEGPKLQNLLLQRAKEKDSWLSEWWLHCAYLGYRLPVVVWSSPAITSSGVNFTNEEQMIDFTSQIIEAGVKFYQDIINDKLSPDMAGTTQLDMSQYKNILAIARVPGQFADTQFRPTVEQAKHILFIHKCNFVKMPIIDSKGNPVAKPIIKSQIENALNSTNKLADHKVGILTTLHRDELYKARQELNKNMTNRKTLEDIESAIFAVCIDEPVLSVPSDIFSPLTSMQETIGAHIALHGCGSDVCSTNRWYDSGIQLLIGKDGRYGMTTEHSTADGPPTGRFLEHTFDAAQKIRPITSALDINLQKPEVLKWDLSEKTLADIALAKRDHDLLVNNVDLQSFFFTDYGKNFPKSERLSPDGFIQLAIQLTYYKLYGKSSPTYESASTRKFYKGRTETIRSCTIESHAFVKAFCEKNSSVTNSELDNLLRKAVDKHRNYTMEAINAQGVDRHLLGLKLLAIENKFDPLPTIFTNYAYDRSFHFSLSTSQVPSNYSMALCFGPVVEDGYGVCYNPQEEQIIFSISSYNSCQETSTNKFINALDESLMQLKHITNLVNVKSKL